MADDKAGGVDSTTALDEDQPTVLEPGLPPEVASPLSPFGGRRPDAPRWFHDALAHEPERSLVPVLGANIELLTWGERGKPGLILIHGNGAHADWWSFIAPFLGDQYRVAALSLSGMGGSDWRESYSFEIFATEIYECARAAGLYDAPVKPVYIGHSFGGSQAFYSAAHHGDRMSACLLVDTGFGGPPTPEEIAKWEAEERAAGRTPMRFRAAQRGQPNRVYPTFETALTRFRFMPPQVPGHLFIADHIARHALKPAPMPDGSGEGWTWRFDPGIWNKLDRTAMASTLGAVPSVPMVHIYGDRSEIIRRHGPGSGRPDHIPASVPRIVIPDSEHHIMVDQPLALIAALRTLLAVWPA